MHPSKKSQKNDRRGGFNPYGPPDRKIPVFFTASPRQRDSKIGAGLVEEFSSGFLTKKQQGRRHGITSPTDQNLLLIGQSMLGSSQVMKKRKRTSAQDGTQVL